MAEWEPPITPMVKGWLRGMVVDRMDGVRAVSRGTVGGLEGGRGVVDGKAPVQ